jgi:K+-sensing histidine kinase KdpD
MNIVSHLLPLSAHRHRSFVFRYLFALGIILAIAVVRVLLDGVLQGRSPYTLFLFALPITAWVVGMRPSLVALLLGALIGSYFFIADHPFDFSDVSDLLALDVYLVAGLAAIYMTNALAKLYQGLMERQAQLEAEISQRLEIDAALRESERRFRVALQNSPITVAHSGPDLRYTWLFNLPGGLDSSEWVGKLDDEFSPPEVAALVLGLKQEVLETGRLIRHELETEVEGQYQAYLISGEPALDENGLSTGVYTTALDISPVKLAERRNALLYQLASALSSVVTLNEIAQVIFSHAFKLLGNSDTGSVRLLNEAGTSLDLLYQQGLDAKYLKQIGSVPLTARTPISDTVRNTQPLWIETEAAFQSAYPEYFTQLSQTKLAKAVFCVPMIVNGRVIGGLGVSFAEERQFSLAERDFYLAVGQVCAQAIERARLTEKAQATAAAEATNEERQRLARD